MLYYPDPKASAPPLCGELTSQCECKPDFLKQEYEHSRPLNNNKLSTVDAAVQVLGRACPATSWQTAAHWKHSVLHIPLGKSIWCWCSR